MFLSLETIRFPRKESVFGGDVVKTQIEVFTGGESMFNLLKSPSILQLSLAKGSQNWTQKNIFI